MEQLASDGVNWLVLYRDKKSGRYWEVSYPLSHMQGGGPPAYRVISAEEAAQKYHLRDEVN